jgi:hypothetical protein
MNDGTAVEYLLRIPEIEIAILYGPQPLCFIPFEHAVMCAIYVHMSTTALASVEEPSSSARTPNARSHETGALALGVG